MLLLGPLRAASYVDLALPLPVARYVESTGVAVMLAVQAGWLVGAELRVAATIHVEGWGLQKLKSPKRQVRG